jgi:hypothetical protein
LENWRLYNTYLECQSIERACCSDRVLHCTRKPKKHLTPSNHLLLHRPPTNRSIRYKKRNAAVAAAAATLFNPRTENPSKLDKKKLDILPQQKSYYRQTDRQTASIRGVDSQPEVM